MLERRGHWCAARARVGRAFDTGFVQRIHGSGDAALEKLLARRSERSLPPDTKRLAAWNGLALSAFARGASLRDGQAYADAAAQLADFLVRELWQGNELLRAVKDAEHPVVWCCDPMHGNTYTNPDGRKTRHFEAVLHTSRANSAREADGPHQEWRAWCDGSTDHSRVIVSDR